MDIKVYENLVEQSLKMRTETYGSARWMAAKDADNERKKVIKNNPDLLRAWINRMQDGGAMPGFAKLCTASTPLEAEVVRAAKMVGAPIGVAANKKPQKWHKSHSGQTYAPPKPFVDLRTGRKISKVQANQIIASFDDVRNDG